MSESNFHKQQGIALGAALIMLILVTLIGLAAIRGVTMQQRMTANFYDREVSFQNAEAGLAAGAAALGAGGATIYNCVGAGTPCLANPFADTNVSGSIQTVGSSTYLPGSNAPGAPQYVIQLVCSSCQDVDTATGFDQSANAAQAGAQGVNSSGYNFYRITARSCNPSIFTFGCDKRAVVSLQATYRQ